MSFGHTKSPELTFQPENNSKSELSNQLDAGLQKGELSHTAGPEHHRNELPDDSGIRERNVNLPDDSGVDSSRAERLNKSSDVSEQTATTKGIAKYTDATDTATKHGDAEDSESEINNKQLEAIKDALRRLFRGEDLTTEEKGNLCEMMMDQYFIMRGYTPIHRNRITSLQDKGHHGIDGVYEKNGHYIIADAKYGFSKLGETQDGMQLSKEWIERRLDDAVGKAKADEIRDTMEDDSDSVETLVYHYDPNPDAIGQTHSDVYHVDESGVKCGNTQVVETYQDGSLIYRQEGDQYA